MGARNKLLFEGPEEIPKFSLRCHHLLLFRSKTGYSSNQASYAESLRQVQLIIIKIIIITVITVFFKMSASKSSVMSSGSCSFRLMLIIPGAVSRSCAVEDLRSGLMSFSSSLLRPWSEGWIAMQRSCLFKVVAFLHSFTCWTSLRNKR